MAGPSGMAGGGCGGKAGPNPGAVTPQPFFETALKGTGYCAGFSSCTAAVVKNEGATGTGNLPNVQVWGIWSDLLDSGAVGCPAGGCEVVDGNVGAFNFPRSLQSTPIPATCNATSTIGCSGSYTDGAYLGASIGHGNYNAGFVSLKMADWKGLTMQNNFTWSKALGLGAQAQSSSILTASSPSLQSLRTIWETGLGPQIYLQRVPLSISLLSTRDSLDSWDECWAAGRSQQYSLPGPAFRRRSVRPFLTTSPSVPAMASAATTTTWRTLCPLAPFPSVMPTTAPATPTTATARLRPTGSR